MQHFVHAVSTDILCFNAMTCQLKYRLLSLITARPTHNNNTTLLYYITIFWTILWKDPVSLSRFNILRIYCDQTIAKCK